MPWYLSRRKISRLLRESRNSITHRLVANESFSDSAIGSFVLFSLVYALVQTVEQILRLRVMMENRLLIRRLVLERILYSELGSLQARYFAVFGESVRTDQLEQIVFNDISETLNLFNTTLPSLMRGAYTLVGSAHDLWLNRDAFDVLAILRPSLVGLTSECVNFVREKYLLDAQTLQQQRNASAASRVVTNIVDGLAEIQTNNLQQFQLRMLDAVSGEELQNQQGTTTFVSNIYRQVSNRSVFDFASEVYVVRMVMNRRKINHETYRQVQNDIDYVTRLFGRLWSQARDAHRVYETQERVIEILNLPTFIQEASMLKRDAPPQRVCPKLAAPYPPAETEETIIESQPDTTQEAASIDDASFVRPSSPDVTVGDVSTAAQLSTSAFQFESLHFRRCAFRYQSHLPLALNLHPRVPGEATTEEDDDSSDEDESHEESPCVGSTRPEDLLREMSTVLAHRRLPTSIMRSMPTSSFDNRSDAQFGVRPRSSSHAHSSVMADIMQSEEAADDADDDTDANLTDDGGDAEDDDYIRALDEFVQQKELANSLIEFASAAVPSAPPSPPAASQLRLNRAESIPSSVPSPLMSPSPPCTACEPGTLLFERGKSYALIGENRSGKSTLMQLLCKLYQPAAADCDIRLNGADFTSLPRVLLRERISYVAQRPFIFPGTIEENIRIGNTTATAAEVERAAEMAGIFTMEQPKSATAANNTATSSYAGRSLVDRTGMQIVAKPWEQNRLKSVLLAVGGWMQRQWMRVHGVEPDDCDPLEEEEDDEEEAEAESQQSSHPCPPAEDAAAAPSPAPVAIHPTLLLETGERGSNLSGGFAQSVALARVFLRKEAQIIILDEAMGQVRHTHHRVHLSHLICLCLFVHVLISLPPLLFVHRLSSLRWTA